MKIIFVAGTDTDAGKTLVTGLLAYYLRRHGYRVVTQKWVQTGTGLTNDIDIHLNLMGKTKKDFSPYLKLIQPYCFKPACSPHLAARLSRKKISLTKIKKSTEKLAKDFDFVIIEGIGGLFTPLNEKTALIDLVQAMRLPVLLVAANKLGAINHTLLSLEALKTRKIHLIGTIFNNISLKEKKYILDDNPRIIKTLSRTKILGTLPYKKDKNELQKSFRAIGKQILSQYE
jgi:dethiobiotin synthetase